jgi:hypothetical protein
MTVIRTQLLMNMEQRTAAFFEVDSGRYKVITFNFRVFKELGKIFDFCVENFTSE